MKHIKHRVQSSLLAMGLRVPAATAGSLVLLTVAALTFGAPSGRAATTCTLTIERAEAQSYATRAVLIANGKSSSETVHYAFEYREAGSSKWEEAESGTKDVAGFEGSVGEYPLQSSPVQHLSPERTYEGRVFVENGCTTVVKPFGFKTTAVGSPEVPKLQLNQEEAGSATELGLEYADYEAEIESNGVETEYRFEVRKEGEVGWQVASGTGTTGTVTVAEDFVEAKAHITGLLPDTKYELRVVSESTDGEGGASGLFMTAARNPEAFVASLSGATASSISVHGTVRVHSSETHWLFEYAVSEGGPWVSGPGGVITAVEAGEGFHSVEGELMGLREAATYYVRLHAENGSLPSATSAAKSFETAGSPLVVTFAAHTYVPGGETVRVLGSVEPKGYETHYRFQYVTQEDFAAGEWASAVSTPEKDAGSGLYGTQGSNGFPSKIFGEDLPALQPGKTYRYRIVASSVQGTVDGGGQTLTAPTPASAEEGACSNESLRSGPSAQLPDCRAYELVTPAEKGGSMDNWMYSGNVSTPVAVGEDGEHVMVKAQYSRWGTNVDAAVNSYFFTRTAGGWQMTSATQQPQAGDESYRTSLFSPDLTQTALTVGWSTGLVADSPNLELEAGSPGGPYTVVATASRSNEPEWVAASSDFSTLILSKAGHLYEWWSGELREIDSCAATIGKATGGGVPDGEVSENGSLVFFEAASGGGCSGESNLYVRVGHKETVDLGAYKFLAANKQGTQLLLERQSGETNEYLLYGIESKTAKLLFSAHESLNPKASKGLSVIYFGSKEQLTADAPSLSAESEDSGGSPEDLYRYDVSQAKLSFIIQTSGNAGYIGGEEGRYYYWDSSGVAAVFSEVNKAFEPEKKGFAVESQVYRYDSVENVVECMSCASSSDPRPELASFFLPEDVEDAADGVPNPMVASENGDYVFFDTAAALVPQDIDGELYAGTHNYFIEEHDFNYSPSSDVYEWRKNGVGGCSHVQGCLGLISSGTGGLKNILLGTTPSGNDVFFATHSQLVGQDTDSQGDVYDARIGGGFPGPASAPVECEADACSTPPSAPVDTSPSSFTFSGAGNIVPSTSTKPAVKTKKSKPKKKKANKKRSKHKQVKGKARKSAKRRTS